MNEEGKATEDLFLNERNGSENKIQTRLKELKGKRTLRELADFWGIPLSTINGWIIRGSQPPLEAAAKVAKAEGISLEWLATGEGQMYEAPEAHPCADRVHNVCSSRDMDDLTKVPTFDVEASAGAGAWINAENIRDYWYVPRTWLRQERLEHAELCIINTIGDSMTPYINHGDRLLVKTNIDREKALDGVFVINLDGHLRVKRLEATLFPAGYRVKSDNELYPPEFVPAAELTQRLYVIGEVVRVFGQPAKPIQPIQ